MTTPMRSAAALLALGLLAACGSSSSDSPPPPVVAFDGTWVVCRNDLDGSSDYREFITVAGASGSIDFIDYPSTFDSSCDGDAGLSASLPVTAVFGAQVPASLGARSVQATKVDVTLTGPPAEAFYTLFYRDTAASPDALYAGDDSGMLDGSTPALRPTSLQSLARALQTAPAIADANGEWRSCPATDGEILNINVAAGTFDYTNYSGPCTGTVLFHSAGSFSFAGPVYASLGGTTVTALAVDLTEVIPAAGSRFATIWVDTSTTPRRLYQGNDTVHGMDGSTASLRPRVLQPTLFVKQ